MSNFYKQAGASHSIGTKIVKEIKSGKFIALGYGNICASELEMIVISSYPERHFAPDSAIGAVAATVGQDYLIRTWPNGSKPGDVVLFTDLPQVSFKYLIVVVMGKQSDHEWLTVGLRNVRKVIDELGTVSSVDVTPLGTRYGGVERKTAFGRLSQWILDLFEQVPPIRLVRITSRDLDTFLDFLESLNEMQSWQSLHSLSADIPRLLLRNLGRFENDIQTVVKILVSNPRAAISICRMIIESIVRDIYTRRSKTYPGNLAIAIDYLRGFTSFPTQFYTYLDVVRRLGNFAIHAEESFTASFKDAEITLSLVLRIIDYWESIGIVEPGGNSQSRNIEFTSEFQD